jgi:hypothetical protein
VPLGSPSLNYGRAAGSGGRNVARAGPGGFIA